MWLHLNTSYSCAFIKKKDNNSYVLFGNKIKPGFPPTDSVTQHHKKTRGLFSLYAKKLLNRFTRTGNRGNIPSCSSAIRKTLESVRTDLPACPFETFLGGTLSQTVLPPPDSNRSFKGQQQNLWYHNWTKSLEINTAAYMRGLYQSYFIFLPSLRNFWGKKTQPLNSRTVWAIDFQPVLLLLLSLRPSSSFSFSIHNFLHLTQFLPLHVKKWNDSVNEDVKHS